MDLAKAIRELTEEKRRLDAVIASLELMLAAESKLPALRPRGGRKRGRKSMSREERLEVSERMKKYWAARRNGGAPNPPENRVAVEPTTAVTAA